MTNLIHMDLYSPFVLAYCSDYYVVKKKLGLPASISFGVIEGVNDDGTPLLDDNGTLVTGPVPYRTFVMLISLACHVAVSTLTDYLFVEEKIPLKNDFFNCFRVSPSSGLIEQSTSRRLPDKQNGINLDDMNGPVNGSYIPRPEYSRNGSTEKH